MATYKWTSFDAILKMLSSIENPDVQPLLEMWEQIIREDNRRGVMAGLDRHDQQMPRVTYRPKTVKGKRKRITVRQRNAEPRGVFAGLGPHDAGLHNNLTSSEYRVLSGPPLAPRRENSRVITNLVTVHSTKPVDGFWFAIGYWDEVVSTTGEPFLMAHFTGDAVGKKHGTILPKRDLRGVRSWGRSQALRAAHEWGLELIGVI